jgi:tetratricopeptide (TPR) repeat protein
MYLSGSRWHVKKKRRRTNPWRILLLLALIAGVVYVERVIVPTVPPLFVPTPTPTQSPALFVLEAQSLFQAGKLEQAQQAYYRAIEIDPQTADYYVELARTQVFAGNPDDAVQNARNALLLAPDSALAHAVLAWGLDFQGNLAEAELEIERALELDPDLALAHAYHAEILMDGGQYEAALEAARRAVELAPDLLESRRALGYVWERTSNYAQAVEAYRSAVELNPNLGLLYISLGNMYLAEGESQTAIDNYLKANALSPTDPDPLTWIAQAYAQVGEYGKAAQYAQNAVEQDPGNPRLHGNLGRMLYKNNQLEEAVAALQIAIRGRPAGDGPAVEGLPLQPGDARVVEFYYTYGLALAKTGACDEAIPIFQALLVAVPGDEIAVVNSTEGLVICGQIEPTPTPRPTASP